MHELQGSSAHVSIIERDFPAIAEVDAKLVKLAKEMRACIITTDYNLNKISQIQGVDVLNVNELAHTVKPVVLAGETLEVRVLREGKEADQGVAYLDDGTMVVIEGARSRVGEQVRVEVSSVLQNPTGKMIFGRIAGLLGSARGMPDRDLSWLSWSPRPGRAPVSTRGCPSNTCPCWASPCCSGHWPLLAPVAGWMLLWSWSAPGARPTAKRRSRAKASRRSWR